MPKSPSDNGGYPLPTHRTCIRCGATKLPSGFGVQQSYPDNIDRICKACRRERTWQLTGKRG